MWNQLLRFAYSWGHHLAIFLYLAETETDSLKDDINLEDKIMLIPMVRDLYYTLHTPRYIPTLPLT
jgi:hypothetical protein